MPVVAVLDAGTTNQVLLFSLGLIQVCFDWPLNPAFWELSWWKEGREIAERALDSEGSSELSQVASVGGKFIGDS